jgi:uncharacterized protein
MKFVNYAKYIKDQEKLSALRPAHREYAAGLMASGKLVAAGPFIDGSGALFIYEADTLQEAESLFSSDPFAAGGVIASYDIAPWQVLGVNADLLRPAP